MTTAALTNASLRASYLALGEEEEASIVSIELARANQVEGLCSGVLIGESIVMSARHCTGEGEPLSFHVSFATSGAPGRAAFSTGGRVLAVHDDFDVALFQLETFSLSAVAVAPLPVAPSLPHGFAVGSLVQIAGVGFDKLGGVGTRGFLVEQVIAVDASIISVSANGLAGACLGDSGGPLLVRGDSGRVQILGVLSRGSSSCFGSDSYVRVDALRAWIESYVPGAFEPAPGEVTAKLTLSGEGRCYDGRAVWAEQGELRAQVCEEGETCGWDEQAQGYRCRAPEADPCAGVNDLGVCESGRAVRCMRGELEENPCGACGFSCGRSPRSGQVVCFDDAVAASDGAR